MKAFFPRTGLETEWNAAFYRLEDYFRALRIVNKVHQSQIILHILEAAAERHALYPEMNPTSLAMDEAHAAMNQWFEGVLEHRDPISITGLISLHAVDAPERWPVAFLTDDIPEECRRELHESEIRAGPDLQVSSMVPRPIDIGPLLDPVKLSETLEKASHGLIILAAIAILTAFSVSIFVLIY